MLRFEIPVRFADLDMLGHVNNVRSMEYVQEARVAMIHDLGYALSGDNAGENIEGVGQYIARIEADYVSPILMGDGSVVIESDVVRIGTSSYALRHTAAVPDGRVVLRARSVMVCVDPVTQRGTPIPGPWREALEVHLVPDES